MNLVSLSVEEVNALSTAGVTSDNELMVLEFADIEAMMPLSNRLMHKKLTQVARFVAMGNSVSATTTMRDVMLAITSPSVARAAGVPTAAATAATPDPSKGAPKISVNSLS